MSASDSKNLRSLLRLLDPSDIEEYSEERSFSAPQKLVVGGESFRSEMHAVPDERPSSKAEVLSFKDFSEKMLASKEEKVGPSKEVKISKQALKSSFYFEDIDEFKASQVKLLLIDAFKLYLEEAQKDFFYPEKESSDEESKNKKQMALVYSNQGILINKKN